MLLKDVVCRSKHAHTDAYITIEYYSSTKKEIAPLAEIQMDLEIIILSEVSQRKTNIV